VRLCLFGGILINVLGQNYSKNVSLHDYGEKQKKQGTIILCRQGIQRGRVKDDYNVAHYFGLIYLETTNSRLHCTMPYCTVLYCIVVYCAVLCCTVLCSIVLYCNALYCTVLCCIVLYCNVLYSTVLYCNVL